MGSVENTGSCVQDGHTDSTAAPLARVNGATPAESAPCARNVVPLALPSSHVDIAAPAAKGICTGLATLPRNAHLDAKALARILCRTVRTIDRATARAELPAPVRFLGRRVWLVGTILDHLAAQQEAALAAAARHEQKISQQTS